MRSIRIAAAQINCHVGDIAGNATRIVDAIEAAACAGADLVALPELAITGYPPEDLLLKPAFVDDNRAALEKIAAACQAVVGVVGFVDYDRDLFNAAAICAHGKVADVYHKTLLPNYGVFDEARYFAPGPGPRAVHVVAGVRVGVSICEDAWSPDGPLATLGWGGAEVIVNINASPYHRNRFAERDDMLRTRVLDVGAALVYVNLVGGQDELVFDGQSVAYDALGRVVGRAHAFTEDLLVVDIDPLDAIRQRLRDPRGRERDHTALPAIELTARQAVDPTGSPAAKPRTRIVPRVEPLLSEEAEVWDALVLGTRDYVRKNGFERVYVALSGGVDSSVVAVIAVDALGPEAVTGVSMPSAISSDHSRTDASDLAENLGITLLELPIADAFEALRATLPDAPWGLAEENLQARVRGNLMMALSNRHGGIVLTTGNKSELATGYCTLYGDMAGGFAVIKDVPKTLLYRVARWRNERDRPADGGEGGAVIPESVLTKPPSAELRPDQLDTDSLPPYDVLDPILELYVEEDRGPSEIAALGFDLALVTRVVGLVDVSEYKRRQAAPGVRISRKAFGKDRRLPITNAWRD